MSFRRANRFGKPVTMEYSIVIEDIDEETYDYLIEWLARNISTTARKTPKYKYGKLVFRFMHEEHAMAFKLSLPEGILE